MRRPWASRRACCEWPGRRSDWVIPPPSGIQFLGRPPVPVAAVDEPVVQAERAVLPELDPLRCQAEARPVGRPRHRADGVTGGELGDPPLQLKAGGQWPRLLRGPGADLARPRTAVEIGVRLGV